MNQIAAINYETLAKIRCAHKKGSPSGPISSSPLLSPTLSLTLSLHGSSLLQPSFRAPICPLGQRASRKSGQLASSPSAQVRILPHKSRMCAWSAPLARLCELDKGAKCSGWARQCPVGRLALEACRTRRTGAPPLWPRVLTCKVTDSLCLSWRCKSARTLLAYKLTEAHQSLGSICGPPIETESNLGGRRLSLVSK